VARERGVGGVACVWRFFFLKPHVTAKPYVSETELTEENLFLVLACDGVWDVLTDEQVVKLVCTIDTPDRAAEVIRRTAFSRGSDDNISVIVVYLKDRSLW